MDRDFRNHFFKIRFFENTFGDVIKGSVALTDDQITALGNGVDPISVAGYANLDVWFPFREQTASVVDLINGHVATRNGTGLITVEHFPIISSMPIYIPESTGGDTNLVILESSHGHSAENVALEVPVVNLIIGDDLLSHATGSPSLTQVQSLLIPKSDLNHTADNLTIASDVLLGLNDGLHGQSAESLSLEVWLNTADAAHQTIGEAPMFTQLHNLIMADTKHGLFSDNLDLKFAANIWRLESPSTETWTRQQRR